MTVYLETTKQRWVGLSTDVKPTSAPIGSEFWCWDTGVMFRCYDGASWIAYSENSVVQPGTIDLHQGAASYDLFTATGGSVYVEYFTLTLPNKDLTDDAALTGITVQTDTTTVVTLIASAAGLKAQLTNSKVFTFATPFALPVGKKIQLTIVGGTATDDPTTCITSCRYRSINPAGYMA
mgnify:CR=1 FL=1